MKIKRLLLHSVVAFCVVSFSPGVLHASNASRLYVTTPGVSFALATSDGASGSTFVWSQVTPTVGAKLKVLEVVSSPLKGTPTYRATGACALRKGVLSFNRGGKCRVSVLVKMKNIGKDLRSSKVFMVQAKTPTAIPAISDMPNPIGCTPAASHPVTGKKYPAGKEPGFYEFQTGWTCNWDTLDARPLLEYFKSQGWVQKSTTVGVSSAELSKGSNHASYGPSFDNMPEGQAFLILTIY